jgi:hypothetical protein
MPFVTFYSHVIRVQMLRYPIFICMQEASIDWYLIDRSLGLCQHRLIDGLDQSIVHC